MWDLRLQLQGLALGWSCPHSGGPFNVGSRPQLIGFIRFGEPVPHGLSARPRVWTGPTKG